MIFNIKKDPSLKDDCLDLQYRQLTPVIEQIMAICRNGTQILFGDHKGKQYNIDVNDVFYIEWVDNHACICTAKEVYTIQETLTQLEEMLDKDCFIRVSKPMLVNVYKVNWVSSGLNMKLTAELINGERIEISRHYRDDLLNAIDRLGRGSNENG